MLSLEQARTTPENREQFLRELLECSSKTISRIRFRLLQKSGITNYPEQAAQQAFLIGANRAIDYAKGQKKGNFDPVKFVVSKGIYEIRNEVKQCDRHRKRPLSNVYVKSIEELSEAEMPSYTQDEHIVADISVTKFRERLSGSELLVFDLLVEGWGAKQNLRVPGESNVGQYHYVSAIAEKLCTTRQKIVDTIERLRDKLKTGQLELSGV